MKLFLTLKKELSFNSYRITWFTLTGLVILFHAFIGCILLIYDIINLERSRGMNKKLTVVLIAIIVVLALALGFVIAKPYLFPEEEEQETSDNRDTEETERKEEPEEITYRQLYEEYLTDHIFNQEDFSEVMGLFLDIENQENPVFVLKYLGENNDYQIVILNISGDTVEVSDEYDSLSVHYLYNIEEDEVEYFIKNTNNSTYLSIKDIIGKASEIERVGTDDFEETYVLIDQPIDFYTIEEDEIANSINKIDAKHTEQNSSSVASKVDDIRSNVLQKDETGIYNSRYKILYGTYVYGDESITLSADGAVFEKRGTSERSGSFYLQYDKIIVNVNSVSLRTYVIEGDNQLRYSDRYDSRDNTIWNLQS